MSATNNLLGTFNKDMSPATIMLSKSSKSSDLNNLVYVTSVLQPFTCNNTNQYEVTLTTFRDGRMSNYEEKNIKGQEIINKLWSHIIESDISYIIIIPLNTIDTSNSYKSVLIVKI
ncbi:hypothetical protein D3C76_1568050 [compost metagenome]